MRFKHLSLDFWHTLAEPNRDYTQFRKDTLAKWYGCTEAISGLVYKHVKNAEEQMAVQSGQVRDRMDLRTLLNHSFQVVELEPLSEEDFSLMLAELEDGFLRMPPHLTLLDEAIATLVRVKGEGVTLSIGSNTNFIIGGAVIEKLLPDIFAFKLFSDQLGRCKPCPRFYSAVALRAGVCNPNLTHTSEILHIGDHEVCDVQGALAMGLYAELVSPERPLTKLLEQLEYENA